jgi:hypothetical protein
MKAGFWALLDKAADEWMNRANHNAGDFEGSRFSVTHY